MSRVRSGYGALLVFLFCMGGALQASGWTLTNIDATVLLPPPPSANSCEARCEIEQILRLQEARTPAEVARVRADASLTLLSYTNVLGSWFTPANLPLTTALFDAVGRETSAVVERAKQHFVRPRPPRADARVQTAVSLLPDASYPSGHSTRGMLFGLILAELVPDQRLGLLERGRELGWERVLAGMHYPSDVAAGRVLAQCIAMQLLRDPSFQVELARARRECEDVRAQMASDAQK